MGETEPFEALLQRVATRCDWDLEKSEVGISLAEGRRQVVGFQPFEFEGRSRVRLFTTIGDASHIDPLRLASGLRINFKLPHGALAVRGDDLVLVDTLSAEADDAQIEAAFRYLAETGDHFERTMFGTDEH